MIVEEPGAGVIYEDNHLIAVNKKCGELVQGDRTGDRTLADSVAAYLKEKYRKSGNVFLGIPHRLDRPTSGAVLYCRTSKALERMNELFRTGGVDKVYHAVCDGVFPEEQGRLEHWLTRDSVRNISAAYVNERKGAKKAVLEYRVLERIRRYSLVEIHLLTGRHHQIRAQFAACGIHIKGDLKYGAARSNRDGGICLHAYRMEFVHPVSGTPLCIIARHPQGDVWPLFSCTQNSDVR